MLIFGIERGDDCAERQARVENIGDDFIEPETGVERIQSQCECDDEQNGECHRKCFFNRIRLARRIVRARNPDRKNGKRTDRRAADGEQQSKDRRAEKQLRRRFTRSKERDQHFGRNENRKKNEQRADDESAFRKNRRASLD